jgi:uncharacterized membrane protein
MRTMMIGIAGKALATAGVVFLLLTLPLSTVASQFGSRILHIVLRDRTTQFVSGDVCRDIYLLPCHSLFYLFGRNTG